MQNRSIHAASSPSKPSKKLQELAQRLYYPEPKVNQVESNSASSLSHVPWTIRQLGDDSDEKKTSRVEDAPISENAKLPPTNPQTAYSFLPVSYLDLRRQQNVAFADEKASQAVEASLLEHERAESLFRQALELVPDHVPSLLGYGKLLYKTGRLNRALLMLEDVLEVEPENTVALQYKKSIEQTVKQQKEQQQQRMIGSASTSASSLLSSGKKRKDLQMRESSAFQDALLERNLAMDGTTENEGEGRASLSEASNGGNDNDNDSYDSDEEDRRRRKRRRHKKDRKRKKKKKGRKKDRHRRHHSPSSASSKESADS